jgi:hypothetical protein
VVYLALLFDEFFNLGLFLLVLSVLHSVICVRPVIGFPKRFRMVAYKKHACSLRLTWTARFLPGGWCLRLPSAPA